MWKPSDPQWWITGFNPDWVGRVDKKTQAVIGRVDFSRFTDSNKKNEVYGALKDRFNVSEDGKEFVVFDDDDTAIWICWYWNGEA